MEQLQAEARQVAGRAVPMAAVQAEEVAVAAATLAVDHVSEATKVAAATPLLATARGDGGGGIGTSTEQGVHESFDITHEYRRPPHGCWSSARAHLEAHTHALLALASLPSLTHCISIAYLDLPTTPCAMPQTCLSGLSRFTISRLLSCR